MKHSQTKINGRILSRSPNGQNRYVDYPICGIANSQTNNNGISKWAVRINRFRRKMYIGICQIRQAQQHQFEQWGWANIGYGHYCIGSNGWVYSHTDLKVNCKPISFKFKVGDILQFEYDSIIGKMAMTVKKNKSQRYEMDIEKSISEKYALCAYLMIAETLLN